MYHPCLLATANLVLILSFPPGKTQILKRGRNIFPQLLEGSAVRPPLVSLIISCAVCFFNVSRRQNMPHVSFFPFSWNQHSTHHGRTPLPTCRLLLRHKREVNERWADMWHWKGDRSFHNRAWKHCWLYLSINVPWWRYSNMTEPLQRNARMK